jgi:hypothetical protein
MIGLVMVMGILGTGGMGVESKRLEENVNPSLASAAARLLKRLPRIWSLKREAKQLAAHLPVYPGSIATPDSETIFSWIRELGRTPHRRPGTAEGHQAENWVADRFRELGLEQVTLDPIPMTVWTAKRWSLSVAGKEIPGFFVVNTGFTGPEGVSAGLVYVGIGRPRDFERKKVAGKIVVAEVPFPKMPYGALLKLSGAAYAISDPDGAITLSSTQYLNFVRQNFLGGTTAETAPAGDVYWQAYRRGAAAVCLILRDQPSNSNTHYGPYDGIMKPLPALWIGKYDGIKLRESAQAGAPATLVLEGGTEPGVMHNVWGVLPGRSEEVILVTSHHDSPFQGAVEDGAGTAQVLAQAWTWARVPREQRPKTLVFVLDSGHFYGSLGAHTFAREHRELMKRVRILITLEHLGGKAVEEKNGEYAETGRLAFTVMFTSPDPTVIAAVMKAFQKKPARMTAAIPYDFFGEAPTSDAAGYVLEAGVPVISWIGCPYYLLDAHDTLDKIEKRELQPIAETVAQLVGIYLTLQN